MAQISGQVKRQILVVGDGKTFVRFMTVLLVRMGLQVITAENGNEALRLARLFRPDVMVLDMDMLAAEGTQNLSTMKQEKSLAEIPVVIVSGPEHEKLKKSCISLGYTHYLAEACKLKRAEQSHADLSRPAPGMGKKASADGLRPAGNGSPWRSGGGLPCPDYLGAWYFRSRTRASRHRDGSISHPENWREKPVPEGPRNLYNNLRAWRLNFRTLPRTNRRNLKISSQTFWQGTSRRYRNADR